MERSAMNEFAVRPSRRDFLGAIAAGGACYAFLPVGSWAAESTGPEGGRVLVLVQLAGGNDGLNTVVPIEDDLYVRLRGDLNLAREAIRIDEETGLHPSLEPWVEWWKEGRLAIVEGLGYAHPNRSHFASTDVWQAADERGRRAGTGWVGRLADALFGEQGDPTNAVALARQLPFALFGRRHRALAFDDASAFGLMASEEEGTRLDTAISSQRVSRRGLEFLKTAYLLARSSSQAVRAAVAQFRPSAEFPSGPTGRSFRTAAALLVSRLPVRIVHLEVGGFDTHSNQAPRQARALSELAQGVAALLAEVRRAGRLDRVAVATYSEFGRRVEPNASGGTDHGTAAPHFVLGGAVRGGRYGARPRLDRLDENGDLVYTTDFRRYLATLVERHMGVASESVLEGRHEPLAFLG